jgi:hypothetical protein
MGVNKTVRSLSWPAPLDRRLEAFGIWLTHGVLDGLSTLIAHRQIGPHLEPNPIVRTILYDYGGLAAFLVLVAVCTGVALVYPALARIGEFPAWFGPLLVGVGAVTAVGNLVSTLLAVGSLW